IQWLAGMSQRIATVIQRSSRLQSRIREATSQSPSSIRIRQAQSESRAPPRNPSPSPQVLVAEFVQALGGDRERRAQLLREERDAQLLDEPAVLFDARGALAVTRLRECLVLRPQALHGRRVLGITLDARPVFLKPQRIALEVARDVLQALPRRAREEAGIDEAV